MNEAEKLLEKFARKNMVQWNQESFKRTHSRLHKSIIEALNEALRIHDVVGRSEQLACIHKLERLRLIGGNITCLDCQSIWVRQAN